MFSLERIYENLDSEAQHLSHLKALLSDFILKEADLQNDTYSRIQNCLTRLKSTFSTETALHSLRVLLILLTENLYHASPNIIYAALLHDLSTDDETWALLCGDAWIKNNDSLKRLVTLFSRVKQNHNRLSEPNMYKAALDLDKNIIQLGSYDKLVFYLMFAERLDDIMMAFRSGDDLQKIRLINRTEKYMLPLVKAAGANRFKDLLLEATFRLSDTVTGSSRAYAAIDKKLRDTNAFNCLPRTERLLGILFPDCRIIYRPPFLYNIHDRLKNILGKPASKLHPSDVIYDIYLLPKGESGRKPSPDSVGFHILQHSADFALEQVSSGVLHIRDTLNNHFRIIISSAQEYSSYMYGQISNGLPLSEQHDIYDSDIPENKKIVVRAQEDQQAYYFREGATLVDYAFARGLDEYADMSTAKVNGEPVEYYDVLQNDCTVSIGKSDTPKADAGWMVYCTTMRAKLKLSRYINFCLEAVQKK